jgi:peptidoglycan hydrolase-like protein with peptidoglycan-binding domain
MTNTTTATAARNSRSTFIAAATLCVIGLAGVITAIIVASTSHHSHALPANHNSNGSHSSAPANNVNPSSSVATLQRELGQLNYYEGPVNGYMTPQTVQAIDNLQRAAGLSQTGTMNAATDNALMNQLAHGDNQMGGN